ncbi:hypothetical protein [Paraflavitalea pollutisoli]|uniref:hypothetical protein n=1 Tax=Paraflavitalea pollutisoli TaxID=3034143 RepID=UPI0023EBEC5F|nr:hypothetical protein [Paraflavitalea sp. H1-2-19X]
MLPYILALIWALMNPHHSNVNSNPNTGQITTMDDDGDPGDGGDTGGETGTIPPLPPKPPKP